MNVARLKFIVRCWVVNIPYKVRDLALKSSTASMITSGMANPSRAVVSSVAHSRFLTQGEAFFMKLDYSNIGMMKYYVLTARYALACFLTESVK